MDFAIVTVPAAPVRRKALHSSEMVSQLLFGEAVRVLKTKKRGWTKIRSLHDQYEGWLNRQQLTEVSEKESRITSEYVVLDMLAELSFNGMQMQVPFGSSLPAFDNGKGAIGEKKYEFPGKTLNRISSPADAQVMINFAKQWLNVPYLWGGRTPLGADCSGFVQVICKLVGIDLQRDTWQQAQEGKPVKKLKEAQAGDLAFFDDQEEIVHVGILLSPEEIIHEYGKVRIDAINKKGIINSDTGERSHRLRAIRRLW